ncbi:MAG: hypothetical protein LBS59_04290 [Puniceicoccales bacterium]|jgi:hypothetical protein|nr:hypothetical protein [Puniceicoccales bacterium]
MALTFDVFMGLIREKENRFTKARNARTVKIVKGGIEFFLKKCGGAADVQRKA